MSKKFLRVAAVAERYSVSPRTIPRMVKDGRLPAPHYRGKFPLFDIDELERCDRHYVTTSRKPKTPAEQAAEA
jgi:excisionase family DNA binding protein